jgi:hypothetical protein
MSTLAVENIKHEDSVNNAIVLDVNGNLSIEGIATVNRIINATDSADPWLKGVNSSNAETSFIKQDGTAFLNVGLGIGTKTPTTGLELSGPGNTTRIKLINGSDQVNFGLWDGSNYRLEGDGNRPLFITSYSSDNAPIRFGINGGTNVIVSNTGSLVVGNTSSNESGSINPTDAVKIQSYGPVSIRSPSANHQLRLESRSDYAQNTEDSTIWVSDSNTGAFTGAGAHLVFEGRRADRNMYFKVGNRSTPNHIFDYFGNVGINTTNAVSGTDDISLHVHGKENQSATVRVTADIASNNQYGSGIDLVAPKLNSSPFIRFYDTASNDINGTIVDDCNWAIGADDSGVSSFKIVYGGASGTNRITDIQGVSAALTIDNNEMTTLNLKMSEISDLFGAASVGSSTTNTHTSQTPAKGGYMVHAFIRYKGTAPGGDPDRVVIEARKNGTAFASANILENDSNLSGASGSSTGLDDFGSFTAAVELNGSDTLSVVSYTTDPGDPGGADYDYRILIYRIGG